jgi:hypothetical protein
MDWQLTSDRSTCVNKAVPAVHFPSSIHIPTFNMASIYQQAALSVFLACLLLHADLLTTAQATRPLGEPAFQSCCTSVSIAQHPLQSTLQGTCKLTGTNIAKQVLAQEKDIQTHCTTYCACVWYLNIAMLYSALLG